MWLHISPAVTDVVVKTPACFPCMRRSGFRSFLGTVSVCHTCAQSWSSRYSGFLPPSSPKYLQKTIMSIDCKITKYWPYFTNLIYQDICNSAIVHRTTSDHHFDTSLGGAPCGNLLIAHLVGVINSRHQPAGPALARLLGASVWSVDWPVGDGEHGTGQRANEKSDMSKIMWQPLGYGCLELYSETFAFYHRVFLISPHTPFHCAIMCQCFIDTVVHKIYRVLRKWLKMSAFSSSTAMCSLDWNVFDPRLSDALA